MKRNKSNVPEEGQWKATRTILLRVTTSASCWRLDHGLRVTTGALPSALSPKRRAALRNTASQATWRLSVVAGLATGFWMFAYGLCFGVTWWAYLLSAGLIATFVAQTAILGFGRLAHPRHRREARQLLILFSLLFRDLSRAYQPAELAVVSLAGVSPIVLNLLGGAPG